MSMNKTNTVDAHVSSTPLVICVGDESRMWEFEENGFLAFVYGKLSRHVQIPSAPTFGDPPSPVTYDANFGTEKLDKRLDEFGLEGRRIVIIAPQERRRASSD